MSMAWTILLALVAGTGGHSVSSVPDHVRAAGDPTIRAHAPGSSRSLSIARKTWHRSCSRCWSLSDVEEFDTEEVDETWMVDLDAVASVPSRWLFLAWSRSETSPTVFDGFLLTPPSHFPLRC